MLISVVLFGMFHSLYDLNAKKFVSINTDLVVDFKKVEIWGWGAHFLGGLLPAQYLN